MFDRDAVAEAIAKHGPVRRVVIVGHHGSTPRETGTAMLVWDNGQSGTIGGGALELAAVSRARQAPGPQAMTLPLGPALGQCCGGSVTVVTEPFTRDTIPPAGEPFARRISGTAGQPLAVSRALARHRSTGETPALVWADGWLCEPVDRATVPVWVHGAGHVGRAIVETLQGLPFDVTWVDTSADRFPETVPPSATPLVAANPADAVRHAPDDAHHLILTYSHALDLDLCHALLQHRAASIGLIGSATKRARFRSRLAALGHDAASIARITCPIGDPALGKLPKAIALGVARDLVQSARREGKMRDSA